MGGKIGERELNQITGGFNYRGYWVENENI
jgi:hypothetical protein